MAIAAIVLGLLGFVSCMLPTTNLDVAVGDCVSLNDGDEFAQAKVVDCASEAARYRVVELFEGVEQDQAEQICMSSDEPVGGFSHRPSALRTTLTVYCVATARQNVSPVSTGECLSLTADSWQTTSCQSHDAHAIVDAVVTDVSADDLDARCEEAAPAYDDVLPIYPQDEGTRFGVVLCYRTISN